MTQLSRGVVFRYGLSALGVGFMWNMLSFYYLKYATDVLLVPPAVMGAIFGASRIWDAVSDPLAGHWSDRTRSHLGRRRVWIYASLVPLSLLFVAVWMPPRGLSGGLLTAWLAAAVFLFYTALTAFRVPHLALGAELAEDYHDRTRVFAATRSAEALGALLLLPALYWILSGHVDQRTAAGAIAIGVALAAPILAWRSVRSLRERDEAERRVASHALVAYRHIFANPHGRRLLLVTFLRSLGLVCVATTLPYACEYVLGDLSLMPTFLAAFCLGYALAMPFWTPLSRRFGKRQVVIWTALLQGAGCVGFFFSFDLPLLLACAALVGATDGAQGTLACSLGADVIEDNDARTGTRSEGAWFAAWSLVAKFAVGAAILAVGVALDVAGFAPGAAQGEAARLAIRVLLGLVPAAFVLLAAVLMFGFSLPAPVRREIAAVAGVASRFRSAEIGSKAGA